MINLQRKKYASIFYIFSLFSVKESLSIIILVDRSRRKLDSARIDRQGFIRPHGHRVERDSQLPEIMTQV